MLEVEEKKSSLCPLSFFRDVNEKYVLLYFKYTPYIYIYPLSMGFSSTYAFRLDYEDDISSVRPLSLKYRQGNELYSTKDKISNPWIKLDTNSNGNITNIYFRLELYSIVRSVLSKFRMQLVTCNPGQKCIICLLPNFCSFRSKLTFRLLQYVSSKVIVIK